MPRLRVASHESRELRPRRPRDYQLATRDQPIVLWLMVEIVVQGLVPCWGGAHPCLVGGSDESRESSPLSPLGRGSG